MPDDEDESGWHLGEYQPKEPLKKPRKDPNKFFEHHFETWLAILVLAVVATMLSMTAINTNNQLKACEIANAWTPTVIPGQVK